MIRFRRLTSASLDAWLVDQHLADAGPQYCLRLWREASTAFPTLRDELRAYIHEALEDARTRLRRGFHDSLSPFDDPALDPAANYPASLHRVTLQGYFGETMAGLAVEHWGAAGRTDWHVPAFLFRFHEHEFQHLEQINQRIRAGERHDPDAPDQVRPGRSGDDALAFRRNDHGAITDVLTLEAKCLRRNNNAKIQEAHEKLAAAGPLPSGIRELIELLSEYDTPEALSWHEALLRFRADAGRTTARHDCVVYATAHTPTRPPRQTWLPPQPHPAYTADRYLEGIEFQFENLDRVIDFLYRGTNDADA